MGGGDLPFPQAASTLTKATNKRSARSVKAELKRRNLSYADLADKLAAIGVKDNERNISNKIGRGTFTAVFSSNAWKQSARKPFISIITIKQARAFL